ncbi:MAG TPA: hypothetical protein VK195_11260 [Burkholderiaceae bacterium]|nr:hypothetical protein [Burkholderiaceae bacterium]
MFNILLINVLLIGYVALAAAFTTLAWRAPVRAKWLGLAAIAAAAPFFAWLGAFSEQFGAGQCYSGVMNKVANAVEHADSSAAVAEQIRALPLRGYETDCAEVDAAARRLPHADAR